MVSPETTLSMTLSLRDEKINPEMAMSINPKIALITPMIGVLPTLALIRLSKPSLTSPEKSSKNSSPSVGLLASDSFSLGVFII